MTTSVNGLCINISISLSLRKKRVIKNLILAKDKYVKDKLYVYIINFRALSIYCLLYILKRKIKGNIRIERKTA